jgi:hypothetical protein
MTNKNITVKQTRRDAVLLVVSLEYNVAKGTYLLSSDHEQSVTVSSEIPLQSPKLC